MQLLRECHLLAHSARPLCGIPAQGYSAHARAVAEEASRNMEVALTFARGLRGMTSELAAVAGEFHDLGKLDAENQAVLLASCSQALPIKHEDAGAAHLLRVDWEAALAAYSHHRGLPDIPHELAQDVIAASQGSDVGALRIAETRAHTDAHLDELIALHRTMPWSGAAVEDARGRRLSGFERRLLLSCLVDADHGDTARHYGGEWLRERPAPRWGERLAALDRYVGNLGRKPGPRTEMRTRIYRAASEAPISPLASCSSPVGSGKTTAVMAYLLRCARDLGLRHVFVVLPYASIIRQAVAVYREALVLPGEDPEKIVVEHHHQADFASSELRYLARLWESPIIVTTAVQFFETLAASSTGRLRKLHELPGSAIFIDEAHAAMPIRLWPYAWDHLKQLAEDWSCRFVLGSGSLARFWTNERIMGTLIDASRVPELVADRTIVAAAEEAERQRVRYVAHPEPLDLGGLCSLIASHPGPRIVVLNTIQSAAVVARELRAQGMETYHISTALTPADRERILDRIHARLKRDGEEDWALVATSCVEAGVDFSFRVGFRERARACNLIQLGGRVNRHDKGSTGVVVDFVVRDPSLPRHPDFALTAKVVSDLFSGNLWGLPSDQLATLALREEFKLQGGSARIEALKKKERLGKYPDVARDARIIDSDTCLVVVDPWIVADLRGGVKVNPTRLARNSVQLWAQRIDKLGLKPIGAEEDRVYAWDRPYDPAFLGVMADPPSSAEVSAI